jgi:hypothetical protein
MTHADQNQQVQTASPAATDGQDEVGGYLVYDQEPIYFEHGWLVNGGLPPVYHRVIEPREPRDPPVKPKR